MGESAGDIAEDVSIHAPARGATPRHGRRVALYAFQFTRPQEARQDHPQQVKRHRRFQFTRPQEARHHVTRIRIPENLFQFTRPQEARHETRRDIAATQAVSIHAPARGATLQTWKRAKGLMFQFTRPQEARPLGGYAAVGVASFNSRARKRRDHRHRRHHTCGGCFNSRARKRRDRKPLINNGIRGVSIHAPARGATNSHRERASP